jgi:outer membrane protein OmpA-like peptidoglycan-associated protein
LVSLVFSSPKSGDANVCDFRKVIASLSQFRRKWVANMQRERRGINPADILRPQRLGGDPMKLKFKAAGIAAAIIALGAAAPMVFAQTADEIVVAQAADEAALAEAQAILAEAGNMQSLSNEDLRERIKKARELSKSEGLPEDVKEGLKNFISAARQEMVTRKSQQEQQQQTEQPPPQPEQQQQTEQPPPQPEQQQQTEQPPPEPQPEQQAEPAPELKVEQPDQQVSEPSAPPAEPATAVDEKALAQANKLLSDSRPASELSVEELRQRIKLARSLARNDKLPADVREQLRGVIETSRQEIVGRESPAQPTEQPATPPEIANVQQAAPPPSEAENRAVEKPKVSNAAEEQAQKLLADNTPLDRLKDEQIRTRLDAYRDLLEEGNLSRETERQLRRKLRGERSALRARIASQEFKERRRDERTEAEPQGPDSYDTGQVKITRYDERPSREEMRFVVNDRRPLQRLSDRELQRRIIVFRELSADERYSEEELRYMREQMAKARRELRRRYEEEKQARARDLDRRRRDKDFDIDIDIDIGGRAPPPVIWAAEEDDEEIEQQLVRRPIRRLERTYDRDDLVEEPEVIFTRPEVRESLPGVEIDTIKFGFNEAFVREEEVQNLDRLGAIIERVVTAHPQELFVIEGHTDAVGSDAYNLNLSKKRAEAVRQILLEFYNIGEENLMTVGLGERYLKIPTPDPEQENRRVTVRRATPLLSEYEPEE